MGAENSNQTDKPRFVGEWVQLGNVATYINGYAFKPSDYSDTGLPIIRIQDLTGNVYQTNCYAGDLPEKYAVDDGDILISWSASLGVFEWDGGPAWLNQHIFKVSFDKMQVDKRFFVHQARFLMEANANLAHGATMRHLTKKVFDSLPFFFPRAERQKAIADQLDGIDIQLCNATNQLCHLDSLIKSRFVEMFGELRENRQVELQNVCSLITDGTHQPPMFAREGIPFLFVRNIAGNEITYETEKFVDRPTYEQLIKRTPIEIGDLLISAVGSFGHPAVIRSDRPFCFQRHIAYLKPKRDMIDSVYLHSYLLAEDAQTYMDKVATGVAQRTVSLKSLKAMPVPLPALTEQQSFASFVSQVNKLRFAIQEQIEKLEALKASLMQEYFGE